MAFINPDDGNLVVINLFKTDTLDKRDRLLKETMDVVDSAGYPGWISSTVHRGVDRLGTLNFIQWRAVEDLQSWYAGDVFKHRDMSVFLSLMTFTRLLQAEMVLSQCQPAVGKVAEISPDRDDYTVVEVLDVSPFSQDKLIAAIGEAHEWLTDVAGYRSQSVLRGVVARGPQGVGQLQTMGAENSFVVVYSQWESKAAYDAFRAVPEAEKPPARLESEVKQNALTVSSDWNSYEVVYAGSAD
jgi:heme-degrading monooxygenase HmoA